MDHGPYRPTHPAQRTTARPAAQAHSEPKPAAAPNAVAEAKPKARSHKDKESPKLLRTIIVALVVLVIVTLGWFAYPKLLGGAPGIDGGKYQAVFLTSGQVYFGKLQAAGNDHMKLTQVFYIQANEASKEAKNPQDNDDSSTSMQLIKLGNEVHGPEDSMIISRDQILFYENLKDDGKVVQTIKQHKQ